MPPIDCELAAAAPSSLGFTLARTAQSRDLRLSHDDDRSLAALSETSERARNNLAALPLLNAGGIMDNDFEAIITVVRTADRQLTPDERKALAGRIADATPLRADPAALALQIKAEAERQG
jgi:hypothetical protein